MTHQEKQKEQSKEWIADAFFAQLQKKNYEDITVSEIVKKADLSRRTFYRIFDSKQDIITCLLDRIMPDYIEELKTLPEKKRDYLAIATVNFVNRHLELFRCLERNHLDYLIIDYFDQHFVSGYKEIWEQSFSDNEEVERIFLMTISVEHYNIIRLWLELCDTKTPEEMAVLISEALKLFQHFQ